jgi:hypothetical protein
MNPTEEEKMKTFEAFDLAFDYCRECNHPVVVMIQDEKWKLFPSGRAERKK